MESSIDLYKGLKQPEGWVYSRLAEILNINYGKGLKEANRSSGNIPVYGSNGVVGQHNIPLTKGATIIIGRKGTVGAVHFSNSPSWPIDTTYFIDDFNGLDPNYLLYSLRSLNLAERDTSTAIPGLNRNDLYDQHIPIPPLFEQNRIVAKVEELLSRVNAARERLAKVQTILKRFRQAVLSAACSGRLTADWRRSRPKITPVDDSIQQILRQREEEWLRNNASRKYKPPQALKNNELSAIPEGWQYIASDALFSFITSGSRGWAKYYSDTGPIFLRVGNLDHNSISLDFSDVQHVNPPTGKEKERTRVKIGDILISITADVGMVALVQDEKIEAYVNQHVAIARPVKNVFRPYLAWYLASLEGGQAQFQNLQRGATKVGLGLEDIKSIAVRFPPIEGQHEIVRRIEAFFKLADMIERRVRTASSRPEKMIQAILAKAFRGELVLTEAELARREGRDYESGSELLQRIQAERGKLDVGRRGSGLNNQQTWAQATPPSKYRKCRRP